MMDRCLPGINIKKPKTMLSCSYKILLAEDERLIRFIISAFFKKCGCYVDEAKNGEEAIRLFETKKDYDMILMDVHMPVMDGLMATEKIRRMEEAHKIKTRIIGISSDEHCKDKCYQHGMDDFYTKPLMIQDIFGLMAGKMEKKD